MRMMLHENVRTTALLVTGTLSDGIIALNNMLCPCVDYPPSSSSFKLRKRAAALSEESEAFRKCFADLFKEIQNPELLTQLYSNNVISKVDVMSVTGPSVMLRRMRLLTAIGDQIAVNPAKFKNLLLALRKQPPLKDIVNKLEEAYRTHLKVGVRGTRLKGVSHCIDLLYDRYRAHLTVHGIHHSMCCLKYYASH